MPYCACFNNARKYSEEYSFMMKTVNRTTVSCSHS
uniref:Uncharacterized protein n=1 Tax=Anguilla anguilla TaxID=7936 RepID=A0A0E9STD5_ANGAN